MIVNNINKIYWKGAKPLGAKPLGANKWSERNHLLPKHPLYLYSNVEVEGSRRECDNVTLGLTWADAEIENPFIQYLSINSKWWLTYKCQFRLQKMFKCTHNHDNYRPTECSGNSIFIFLIEIKYNILAKKYCRWQ